MIPVNCKERFRAEKVTLLEIKVKHKLICQVLIYLNGMAYLTKGEPEVKGK